ncbi:MAG: hypothetical protein AB7U20_16530 [Planctomycetaceae bacterium]
MPSLDWLKHAFAVGTAERLEPAVEQSEVVDRLCGEIVRRGLTTPAIVYLEMSRPLGFLAAQAIHFFTPLIAALTDAQEHRHFADFLEQRGAIDYLLGRIDAIEREGSPRRRRDTEEARSEEK